MIGGREVSKEIYKYLRELVSLNIFINDPERDQVTTRQSSLVG